GAILLWSCLSSQFLRYNEDIPRQRSFLQFGHCALVLYSFCHLLWSLQFNYRYCLILFCCAMILLAQSEAHISPAAIIITSFITNLPAPDKYGNPNCGVAKSPPRSGTYTSGVVNRNVKVTKDIPNVSTP